MTGVEYRVFVRNTLRVQIVGFVHDTQQSTLLGLVRFWEERQDRWHQNAEYFDEQAKMFGEKSTMRGTTDKESRFCFRALCQIREAISRLDM